MKKLRIVAALMASAMLFSSCSVKALEPSSENFIMSAEKHLDMEQVDTDEYIDYLNDGNGTLYEDNFIIVEDDDVLDAMEENNLLFNRQKELDQIISFSFRKDDAWAYIAAMFFDDEDVAEEYFSYYLDEDRLVYMDDDIVIYNNMGLNTHCCFALRYGDDAIIGGQMDWRDGEGTASGVKYLNNFFASLGVPNPIEITEDKVES